MGAPAMCLLFMIGLHGMNSRPLSILMISNNYTPYRGGLVSALEVLCTELERAGHIVHLITLDFGIAQDDPSLVARVPSIITFKYRMNWMAIPWRARSFIDQQIRILKPDIIHMHHPFLLGVDALALAKRYSIPTVFSYHTRYIDYSHYVPFFNQNLTQTIIQRTVNDFCSRVDHIIVPTLFLKDELSHQITTPITAIPTAIPDFFFSNHLRKSNQLSWQLITVGRLVPEKNIGFLLRAMNLLNSMNYRLTIVGDGFLRDKLEQYAYEKLRLDKQAVDFYGYASKSDLVSLYQQADLFIFASQTETQGLVFAEAMAAGLPIVAYTSDAAAASIDNEKNGLLVSSEQEMADAISTLRSDSSCYQSMKDYALQSAKKYKATEWIKKIIHVYQKLLGKNIA